MTMLLESSPTSGNKSYSIDGSKPTKIKYNGEYR